ncbi:acetylxylan esterase, partial [Pirellulales bacterium]|nr:acetylxylan esterase [Pirellulales bacterium]
MPSAGFAEIECQLVTSKNKKTRSARYRIGSHVEDIVCPLTRESDFFNFWQDSLAQLASTAPNFQLRPHEQPSQSKVSLFEVSMQSFDNVCVRGWLEIPKQDGLFPTVLRVPGYGQNMKPVGDQEDLIVFSFNPRGHGNSQDDISGKPQDYWVRGLDDRDTYFYRGAYLDCVRAVDFLCTLDKANQQQIAIWGASQGGGFAFATAALDNRIDLCVADIPFLCNWANYFKLTHW